MKREKQTMRVYVRTCKTRKSSGKKIRVANEYVDDVREKTKGKPDEEGGRGG